MTDERTPVEGEPRRRESRPHSLVTLEELWHTEDRVMDALAKVEGAVAANAKDVDDYIYRHAVVHEEHDGWSRRQLEGLLERLHALDLDRARQQGALGILRWAVDLAGRNWKVILVLAGAALTFLGNIHIGFTAQ